MLGKQLGGIFSLSILSHLQSRIIDFYVNPTTGLLPNTAV